MTREDIDKLWNRAIREAIEDGNMCTRYHFAALVAAAEREACAKHAEDFLTKGRSPLGRAVGEAIRARGETK